MIIISEKLTMAKVLIWSIGTLLLVSVIGFALYVSAQSDNMVSTDVPESYAYHALGQECNEAIAAYDKKLASMKADIDELSATATAWNDSIAANTQAYGASQSEAYLKAQRQISQLYASGDISAEEYSRRMAALQPVMNNVQDAYSDATRDTALLGQSSTAIISNMQAELTTMTDKRNQLIACVDAANNQRDFTISDVANFNSLIAGSK